MLFRSANWLYQLGPKDGTAIGTFGRGTAFDPMLGLGGPTFDPAKYNWLGSANDEVSVCVSWHKSGITTIEQLKKEELIVGSTGTTGDDEQFPKILNAVLGTKMSTVSGYPGGNEIKLAMEKGEVNGRCGWSWSSVKATQAQWVKDKLIHIFIQLGLQKHPDLPDVPLVMDLARNDEERQIFKVSFARQVMGWPYVAPPGVPADRLAALRKAFIDMTHDREYLAEAERLRLEVRPVSGESIQTMVEDIYRTTSPDVARKIGAMIK